MRRWLTAALLVLSATPAAGSAPSPVAFCHDSENRPPRFFLRGGEWHGRDMETLTALFAHSPREYRVDALPWRRCLQSSRAGKQHQAVLSATYSVARTRRYYFSDTYYSHTPAYLYLSGANRPAPDITRPTDLYRYRVCGVAGFNYVGFNLSGKGIDQGAKNLSQLISKLMAGRCDIALSRSEIIRGRRQFGRIPWPENLELRPIPQASAERYYIMVSRNAPNAQALVRFLNRGIERLGTPRRDTP